MSNENTKQPLSVLEELDLTKLATLIADKAKKAFQIGDQLVRLVGKATGKKVEKTFTFNGEVVQNKTELFKYIGEKVDADFKTLNSYHLIASRFDKTFREATGDRSHSIYKEFLAVDPKRDGSVREWLEAQPKATVLECAEKANYFKGLDGKTTKSKGKTSKKSKESKETKTAKNSSNEELLGMLANVCVELSERELNIEELKVLNGSIQIIQKAHTVTTGTKKPEPQTTNA